MQHIARHRNHSHLDRRPRHLVDDGHRDSGSRLNLELHLDLGGRPLCHRRHHHALKTGAAQRVGGDELHRADPEAADGEEAGAVGERLLLRKHASLTCMHKDAGSRLPVTRDPPSNDGAALQRQQHRLWLTEHRDLKPWPVAGQFRLNDDRSCTARDNPKPTLRIRRHARSGPVREHRHGHAGARCRCTVG